MIMAMFVIGLLAQFMMVKTSSPCSIPVGRDRVPVAVTVVSFDSTVRVDVAVIVVVLVSVSMLAD
jgi:hypothetical protein